MDWGVFLCDHLAHIGHHCIKIHAIFLWLGPDNIDPSLQLSVIDALGEVADFSAIGVFTVVVLCKGLYDGMLFCV